MTLQKTMLKSTGLLKMQGLCKGIGLIKSAFTPSKTDLSTYHKTITDNIFAESKENLPATFLPRVGKSNGTSEKLTWDTKLCDDLTTWSVAFRMNNYQRINASGFIIGGSTKSNLLLSSSSYIAFRCSTGDYYEWNGDGNTTLAATSSIIDTYSTILFRSDGTNIHLILNGIDYGYITPENTKLIFDRFILAYYNDALGADGTFWDLRFWDSDIGNIEALKYHLYTITVNPTNWFPDVYSGYDVSGDNHATSNLDSDYDLNGSLYSNKNGYSLWQHVTLADIQVPFDVNGNALVLTAGVNIPTGYSKTRDVVTGGNNWNMADALIGFNENKVVDTELEIFDRSNIIRQTAISRASDYYIDTDLATKSRYHISEIADPRIYNTFFEADYQDKIFGKVVLDGTDIIRLDEFLNYSVQQVTKLQVILIYCKITDIYP